MKVTAPLRTPELVGEKVTVTVQFAPAEIPVPHVLVCPKSPLGAILEKLIPVVAVFVSVTDCATLLFPTRITLENVSAALENLMYVPIPASETVCGLVGSLSVMVIVPVRIPPAVGWNVIMSVHCPPPSDGSAATV
jgi:hypothetical protein